MALNRRVVSSRFPYLPLHLEIRSVTTDMEALLDTGFDGDVAVAAELVAHEQPDGYEIWRLANGSEVLGPWYRGSASIGHLGPVTVVVIALGDEYLVGHGVTDHFSVTLVD